MKVFVQVSLFLLAIFVLVEKLQGQDLAQLRLSGRGERLSGELVDRTTKDVNGQVCAALVVVSDLDGLTYDSNNGVVKVNRSPGKDVVFLSSDERVLTILKTGYQPLKIILSELSIKFASGEVWQIRITGDKKLDQVPVNILTDPVEARIIIDGANKGTGKSQQLSIGRHQLRIEKPGFKPRTETIDISLSNTLFNFRLDAVDVQSVSLKSLPAGAKITVDNIDKGETDKGFWLYPGKYRLILSKSGYLNFEKEFEVVEGTKNEFAYSLTKNSGVLNLTVVPIDANVLINKEDYSGRATLELAPGRYKIEVEKTGYLSTSEAVDIILGTAVTKRYTLVPRTGNLQFSVQPLDAMVELRRDGRVEQSWQGMNLIKGLQVGEYDLECTLSGYAFVKKKIQIEEDKTVLEEVVLTKGQGVPSDMVYVEGGSFEMGSNNGRNDEKPVHRVAVSSFFMDKYEVTVAQYRKFCKATMQSMPSAPYSRWQDNQPIVNVSWVDAAAFAKWTGKRLPTEAEWEYAARGGTKSHGYDYSGSNTLDNVGWYGDNSNGKIHPIGEKQPNEIGLYDMSGNVWEWCSDWYSEKYYGISPERAPQGPSGGTSRVLRGASWNNSAINCRVATRESNTPVYGFNYGGFRCVQDTK